MAHQAHKAHKAYKPPASLHISIHAGHWHVSFNYDDNSIEPTDKDTTAWLTQFNASELQEMTVWLDRGVALPLAGSDGQQFDFLPVQVKRLAAQEKHKKSWPKWSLTQETPRYNLLGRLAVGVFIETGFQHLTPSPA